MIKLNLENFLIVWKYLKKNDEIKDYIPTVDDLFFIINGYLFIVQRKDDVNNIIMAKIYKTKSTLKQTLKQFYNCLLENEIYFVRIEGTLRRYNFLEKMFPGVIKDNEIKERNVFYVNLRGN